MTSNEPHDTDPPGPAEDTLVDVFPWHDFEPDALDLLLYRALGIEHDEDS